MSAPVVGILILAGLACLAGVFFVNYSIERARVRRHANIAKYTDNAHRYQRYLDYIPPNYIEKGLRILILQEIINNLQKVLQIDANNANVAAKIQTARNDLETTKQNKNPPKIGSIKDVQEAADVRKRLMDLFKFVQHLHKTKKIDGSTANKHLAQLKNLFVEVGVSIQMMRAKQGIRDKKPRLGVHFYSKAMAEYKKGNTHKQFDAQIAELKKMIDELNGKIKAEADASKPPPKEEPKRRVPKEDPRFKQKTTTKKIKEDTTLSKELDAFIEDDNAWKKKTF